MIKIGIIGGLSNGQILHDYFYENKKKEVEITFVCTYEDKNLSIKSKVKTFFEDSLFFLHKFTNLKELDFIFVAGWSKLIPKHILEGPKKGCIGFHPSDLPKDRGRSVLGWQISEGYKSTALTMFYFVVEPDAGDIIHKEYFDIAKKDTIKDVLKKIDSATFRTLAKTFPNLLSGTANRIVQDHSKATYRRLRNDSHSTIDWNKDTKNILNLIRAITRPYPGSISYFNQKKYRIWKAEEYKNKNFYDPQRPPKPGEIIKRFSDNTFLAKTSDGLIRIVEYENE